MAFAGGGVDSVIIKDGSMTNQISQYELLYSFKSESINETYLMFTHMRIGIF